MQGVWWCVDIHAGGMVVCGYPCLSSVHYIMSSLSELPWFILHLWELVSKNEGLLFEKD